MERVKWVTKKFYKIGYIPFRGYCITLNMTTEYCIAASDNLMSMKVNMSYDVYRKILKEQFNGIQPEEYTTDTYYLKEEDAKNVLEWYESINLIDELANSD